MFETKEKREDAGEKLRELFGRSYRWGVAMQSGKSYQTVKSWFQMKSPNVEVENAVKQMLELESAKTDIL
jgi:hypothetical protein